MERGFIICVDDQPAILDSLMTQLERAVGDICDIETAESAAEALALLDDFEQRGERVEMVIADEVMPGMKGAQLLEIIHKRSPEIIKVMLTGQAGLASIAYAINNAGLDKYFSKPWEYEDLKLTLQSLLEKERLARKNKKLTQELQEKYKELRDTYNEMLLAYKQLQERQAQLIHAEKLALVGQLSGRIVHEVKNQLNIIGFAELIRDFYPEDAKLQRYTGHILNAAKNIYNLIEEMRRLAKKEQRQYEMGNVSITDVLDKIVNFIQFDKLLEHRTLTTDFQARSFALLNEEKFGQVIINLIRNAAYATSDDTGEIYIRVTTNGRYTLIAIQDNGCGIPEEHLKKIWDPFFTTKGEEGTGLGLDICKRIIAEHHGTITCTSQVNIGTTFTISLPVVEKERDT